MELVHHSLERSARRTPDRIALVCGDARLRYVDLDAAATRLAAGLIVEGIAPGDRVAIVLENSVEAVIAIFGVLKAGAVFTALNPSTKADKLAEVLRDERAAALIAGGTAPLRRTVLAIVAAEPPPVSAIIWVGGVPEVPRPAGGRFLDWDRLLAAGSREPAPSPEPEADLGTIIYTSGTTGSPKGVMCGHADMVFATRAIATYLENSADDVIFCALSLAFTYGLYQLLTAVLVGATLVLEPNFVFPRKALEVMTRERVTGLPAVPTMYALLLRLGRFTGHDLPSLRYLTNAAAPLPVPHIRALRAAFPGAKFFSMYGQTECKRACYLPPEEVDRRPDSVGIPLPGTRAYVVDHAGNRVPPGAVGELVLAGPHLMRGYWDNPEATARRLRHGPVPGEPVMYTGDLFRADEEGFLYFVSREDDIIKSRGEKVSPLEIEQALHDLPGVREVAAIGVPDDLLGEAIKVVVVPEPGARLTAREVRAHCARHLEDFLVPKLVEFRDELPKSGNGKTIRSALRVCAA